MVTCLIFRLSGDFASWGDIALGELRPTATHPSRSALLGMLGSCLGIYKEDWDKKKNLSEALTFAVRVDEVESRIYDYQTTQVVKGVNTRGPFETRAKGIKNPRSMPLSLYNKVPNGAVAKTMLSQREYCVSAHYTIATMTKSIPLESLVPNLEKPVWNPTLGRFCCLCNSHLDPQIIEATSVVEALQKSVFPPFPKVPTQKRKSLFWEQGMNAHMGVLAESISKRRDDPNGMYFLVRNEYHAQIEG